MYALRLLNTVKEFITTTLTDQPQFKENEIPGGIGNREGF